MSIMPKETIEVIAQSIGISNFSSDVAPAIASDVEYRVREIMQVATQFVHLLSICVHFAVVYVTQFAENTRIRPSFVQI